MNESINCFSNDTLIQKRHQKKKRKKIEEGGKKNRFHFRWEDCEPPVMSYIATKVIILSELAGELKTALERQ